MKKGFTLMELLGSVVIMSIVLTIATISVISVINSSKQKAYNTQVQLIVSKAKDWALNNETKLTPDGGINFIELSTLVSSGYIDNSTVSDPRNGSTMTGCVVVTYNSETSQYDYKYSDSSCAVEQEKYGPTWTSTNPTTVEVGTIFSYGSVTAQSQSSKKNELTVTGPTIDIVDGEHKVLTSNVDVVDTSYVGRIYSLTYYAYDPIYKFTFKNTYYLTVVDKKAPVITIGKLTGTEEIGPVILDTQEGDGQADVYVLTDSESKYPVIDMIVDDNSCDGLTEDARSKNNCGATLKETMTATTIDLTKPLTLLNESPTNVTYTATDSSGNKTSYTVHYYVAPKGCIYPATKDFTYNNPGDYYCQIYYPYEYVLTGNGAQGGTTNSSYPGGNGGYISGSIKLEFGDQIKISIGNVEGGGAAASGTENSKAGGKSTTITRIRKGTSNYVNEQLLVAAGGGAGGSLSSGGDGGSGTGAGADWPAVCYGKFGTQFGNQYGSPTINIDTTDTTSSGSAVCPYKETDATPTIPTKCSTARGGAGTNGSGGGSSGTLTFPAHQCVASHDPTYACKNITNPDGCEKSNFGCEYPSSCAHQNFGCKTWNQCDTWGTCSQPDTCTQYYSCVNGYTDWTFDSTQLACGPKDDDCDSSNCSQYDFTDELQYGSSYSSGGGCKTKIYSRSYTYGTCSYDYACTSYYSCVVGQHNCDPCTSYYTSIEFLSRDSRPWQERVDAAAALCGCATHYSATEWLNANSSNYSTNQNFQSAANLCGCSVYNWVDTGTYNSEVSYGYGAQGGTSGVYNNTDLIKATPGSNPGNGSATVILNK